MPGFRQNVPVTDTPSWCRQAEDHKARKEAKKEQAKEVRATKRQKTDCAVQSMTEDEKKAFREQAKVRFATATSLVH